MSVHPTITHVLRRLAATGILLAALAFAPGAAAADAAWTDVDGNPRCSAVGPGYREFKIDPVPGGRHAFGDGTLSGVVDVQGVRFDWSANQGVDAVIVKGGPNARIYRAATEMTSGSGLHAPINPRTGKPYGLSHISFCYDLDAPPPPPAPCEPGGATTMPDGRPCQPPPAVPGPCEPGGATTMPDGRPCQPSPPVPGPCEPGGATTMPDGQSCQPPATPDAPAGGQDAPQGEVLSAAAAKPARRVAARARMSSPRRCVARPFRQVVRGKGIRRVTFFVNGRRVARLRGSRTKYAVRVNPRKYAKGVMRIRARVQYVAASRKHAQTLRATVLSCAPRRASARPRLGFAG